MFASPKTLVLLGLFVPYTLAQYGGAPAPVITTSKTTAAAAAAATSATTTSSAAVASNTQVITAGLGGDTVLTFTPSSIVAAPGTFVEFQFMPVNHSVAESSFANPCSPVNSSTFFAGFNFVTNSGMAPNSFLLEINSTDPVWFYCPQTTEGISHCTSGMVGVINPPAGKTQIDFATNAAASNVTVIVPAEVQGGIMMAANAASPSSSASGSAASTSSTATSSASHSVGMGLMGLVGIAFSALLSF